MSTTSAKGFRAAGVAAGLKATGKPDVAIVINDGPLDVAAAVLTANRVFAAPVAWTRQAVKDGRARAVVLNSGGANACTGPGGFADTHRTAEHAAEALGLSAQDVLVCSTGLIGVRLPMDNLLAGVSAAATKAHDEGGPSAAVAIMTTDTVTKTVKVARENTADRTTTWTVGGMAKGAGMLAPGLATMLCVLTTDAVVDAESAGSALRDAVAGTFDRIDSDGCMSTNDSVILLASGASGIEVSELQFAEALTEACASLARQLVADAEGATHDIAVAVHGATTEDAAVAVARVVARSNLFKAAVYGNDPNWGRVLSAVGTVPESVAPFDPNRVDVAINGVWVCKNGGVGADRDLVDMTTREIQVDIELYAGDAHATVWTNDLTHDYVEENSAYSS